MLQQLMPLEKGGSMTEEKLTTQKCESCAGLAPLSFQEAEEFMKNAEVEGWMLSSNGTPRINKTFKFESMRMAEWHKEWGKSAEFVRKLLDLMEEEDHHASYTHVPAKNGGSVNVILITHAVRGLSRNDFVMAAKLNKLFAEICSFHK